MKKVLFACAIVLICMNLTSCTRVPVSENPELSTGGEDGGESDNPDND